VTFDDITSKPANQSSDSTKQGERITFAAAAAGVSRTWL
jgi:hypothetical protein